MNPIDKIILGAGIVAALAITIGILTLCFINAHLRVELADAEANATACSITNDDFRRKAEAQDQAIAALKAASDAHAKEASAALLAAEKSAAAFQADSARLAKQKTSGDACKAAEALFGPYVGGGK